MNGSPLEHHGALRREEVLHAKSPLRRELGESIYFRDMTAQGRVLYAGAGIEEVRIAPGRENRGQTDLSTELGLTGKPQVRGGTDSSVPGWGTRITLGEVAE